jgi:hypothetical protein
MPSEIRRVMIGLAGTTGRGIYAASAWITFWCLKSARRQDVEAA